MVRNITIRKGKIILQKSAFPHNHAFFISQGNLRMSRYPFWSLLILHQQSSEINPPRKLEHLSSQTCYIAVGGKKSNFQCAQTQTKSFGWCIFFCIIVTTLLSLYQYTLYFPPKLCKIKSSKFLMLEDFTWGLKGTYHILLIQTSMIHCE